MIQSKCSKCAKPIAVDYDSCAKPDGDTCGADSCSCICYADCWDCDEHYCPDIDDEGRCVRCGMDEMERWEHESNWEEAG